MNNEEENTVYISTSVDPIAVILGVLASISLVAANIFIYTMPTGESNGWIKHTIGILFNFLWVGNFYRWIIQPLKSE